MFYTHYNKAKPLKKVVMILILVRHGQALNHDIDALRPLSKQGKEEATQAGLFINKLEKRPREVFHSELLRAKETATLMANELQNSPQLEEAIDLTPNSSIMPWYNNLMAYSQDDVIALVGHMPYMGIMASELSQRPIGFPTGGVVVMEGEGHQWRIKEKNFD
jgi:phosphohistidine phosphatase